jgi:pimeloyl-ACP methyl ester carboxylesterase
MNKLEYKGEPISKQEFVIGGITVYVYNADKLEAYIDLINSIYHTASHLHKQLTDVPINTVYLIHGRGQDYTYTEQLAYNILSQYYEKKDSPQVPMICITFDNRNHGQRLVGQLQNSSWNSGNETHALDMVSAIDGVIDDIKLIMQYLPSYLNLEYFLDPKLVQELGTEIKYVNILSGVSFGGHTVIRFASKYPQLVDAINPIVGCSDLTSLLVNRLVKTPIDSTDYDKKLFYFNYDELPISREQQKVNYPPTFHQYLSSDDQNIWENFPMRLVKMFAAFGGKDVLVPPKLSKFWVESYESTNSATELFTQEDAGHECTSDMIDRLTTWLAKYY